VKSLRKNVLFLAGRAVAAGRADGASGMPRLRRQHAPVILRSYFNFYRHSARSRRTQAPRYPAPGGVSRRPTQRRVRDAAPYGGGACGGGGRDPVRAAVAGRA